MRKYYITNWRLLIGSLLGFSGSLFIASDKFPPIHEYFNDFNPWRELNVAIVDIQTFDYTTASGRKAGYITRGDTGFDHLIAIISDNRADISITNIIGIGQNTAVLLGGVPANNIHLVLDNKSSAQPLTTTYIFNEWVTKGL